MKFLDNTGLTYLWGKIKATFYSKPSGGIPATDLASAVQTSLGKADTALQSFTESDPVFSASVAANITDSDVSAWNNKQNALTFDSVPTENSTNPVTSNGIYTALVENEEVIASALNDLEERKLDKSRFSEKQDKIDATHKLSADLVDDGSTTNKFVTAAEKTTWNSKSDFSGSYNDLTNKPTIPEAQVNSDWNASSGVAQILNKPTISTITFRQW